MKRRILAIAAVTLLAVVLFAQPASAAIDGSYQSGTTPTNITIYYEDTLSPRGYVDLRTATFIPAGFTIDYGITVKWTASRYGYYGMQVYLYNGRYQEEALSVYGLQALEGRVVKPGAGNP